MQEVIRKQFTKLRMRDALLIFIGSTIMTIPASPPKL